jgi:hypothetical protein
VLSNRICEQLALQLIYLVGYNYFHGKAAWSFDRFVEYLDLPGEPVSRMLGILVDAGYLIEVDNEGVQVYLPLHDLEKIRLVDVLADVRSSRESRLMGLQQLAPVEAVDRLVSELNAARQAALGERTLRNLVQAVDEKLEAGMQDPAEVCLFKQTEGCRPCSLDVHPCRQMFLQRMIELLCIRVLAAV